MQHGDRTCGRVNRFALIASQECEIADEQAAIWPQPFVFETLTPPFVRRGCRSENRQFFGPTYGVTTLPSFKSGGYRTTSTLGSLNWSTSWPFTFWNCTSITRASVHSPLTPKVMSPATVLKVCDRM